MYPYVQSSTIYIKTWKHPKCPLENEWINKMWYTYTTEYLLFLVSKFCLILCNPMDCSPPGSSVHGISQARIHEWVAISFSRRSSQPRDRPHDSCIGRQSLTAEPPGKATMEYYSAIKRDEIWVICTGSFPEMQMDLQSVTHSEVSQKEKNKYHILTHVCGIWGFPGAARGKELTCQCRTHYRYGLDSWAGEDHLEEGIATQSNVFDWKKPWIEEPGRLLSTGSQKVRHDWSNLACMHMWNLKKNDTDEPCRAGIEMQT